MMPTDKQVAVINQLYDEGYMTDKQYRYAIGDIGMAYKIIETSLKYKRQCMMYPIICVKRTKKTVKNVQPIEGIEAVDMAILLTGLE